MLHKEVFMKRNILIAPLLTFTMMLVTACDSNSSNKNDNNKFKGLGLLIIKRAIQTKFKNLHLKM